MCQGIAERGEEHSGLQQQVCVCVRGCVMGGYYLSDRDVHAPGHRGARGGKQRAATANGLSCMLLWSRT